MRTPAVYPTPTYQDPNDQRLVQIIKKVRGAQPHSANLLGVPYDGAVLGRKGAAGGPGAIRQSMLGFSNYDLELGIGLEKARIFDLGDLAIESGNVTDAHRLVESEVSGALRNDSILVVLGGDNSISLPALAACAKKFGRLGLVVVDSHLDLRGKIGRKPTSGSSYGLAVGSGIINPKNVVEIGVHGFLNSRAYFEKARKLGIKVISAEQVRRMGPLAIAREAYKVASKGTDAVYLSIDMDAVDLSQVSGVSAPSVGGVSAESLLTIAYEIANQSRVRCADLVELAPALDVTGNSQRVAATVLAYLVAGFHSRRSKR